MNFGLLFRYQNFSSRYLAYVLSEHNQIWPPYGLVSRNLFPKFHDLWSGGPVIPCGDMHHYFTDTLVKWFFNNFPMFSGSFNVLSIHCVARGSDVTFLYRRLTSRGGSLQQHSLLVSFLEIRTFRPLQTKALSLMLFSNFTILLCRCT